VAVHAGAAVPTKADTLLEGPETFTVTLSPPSNGATLGAPSSAVVTIVDAQAPRVQFAKSSYTVAESAGAVTLTVMRVGPAAAQNTVSYSVAGVTATPSLDFADTGGTLTFGPGITSRQIVIPIVGDQLNEGPETLTVTLSSPTGGAIVGAPAVATVTITDDDPPVRCSSVRRATRSRARPPPSGDAHRHVRAGDGGFRDESRAPRRETITPA
jgi:hypothetical protein